jgi:glutamyl/glutaminyl-tRNA synthetase
VEGADLKAVARSVSARTGRRGPLLYKPLRAGLTGALSGPELAPVLGYLGPIEAIRRFDAARALAA